MSVKQQRSACFCLELWNRCHRRRCPDRFDCQCRNGSQFYSSVFTIKRECIDLSWLCDGIRDCSGGEDEVDCVCADDQFQCNVCKRVDECDDGIPFHQCINKTRVGDRKKDCRNGRDESELDLRYLKVLILLFTNIVVNN